MMTNHQQAEALRQWLKYPTWSIREGLLLLAGIDPLRADCLRFNEDCTELEASADPESLPTVDGVRVGGPTWCRLGSPERIESGPDGSLHIVGAVFVIEDMLRLHQLMEHWSRTPEHDGLQRATPAQFIAVAERAELPPTWLEAARLAGLLPHQSEPPTSATPAALPGAVPAAPDAAPSVRAMKTPQANALNAVRALQEAKKPDGSPIFDLLAIPKREGRKSPAKQYLMANLGLSNDAAKLALSALEREGRIKYTDPVKKTR